METKNYTITCTWIGEVNNENIKEMAKVMMWNCCVAQYKDGEIICNSSVSMGLGGKPNTQFCNVNGVHYNFVLESKRVSAKMGEEIIANILKAVEEYKFNKA